MDIEAESEGRRCASGQGPTATTTPETAARGGASPSPTAASCHAAVGGRPTKAASTTQSPSDGAVLVQRAMASTQRKAAHA